MNETPRLTLNESYLQTTWRSGPIIPLPQNGDLYAVPGYG
jgi:hypothetical protein